MGYGRFVDARVIRDRMQRKDERIRRETAARAATNLPTESASNFPGLANPKPEPRKREKDRKRRQFAKARKSCRAARYLADGGRCVRCGKRLFLNPSDEGVDWYNVANINETRPRSLGGDPLDPKGQTTLCAKCHTGSGRHRP